MNDAMAKYVESCKGLQYFGMQLYHGVIECQPQKEKKKSFWDYFGMDEWLAGGDKKKGEKGDESKHDNDKSSSTTDKKKDKESGKGKDKDKSKKSNQKVTC